MEDIRFLRYSPRENNFSLTAQLIECYRDVFADRPWHEWLKCPQCQSYWGVRDRALLVEMGFRHCGVSLIDFWDREQVLSDLYHEIVPEASCWIAMSDDLLVGFCWGYPITIKELEEKIGVGLNGNFSSDYVVAYQDEVGVLPAYRNRKIAKAMVARRLDDFLEQGLPVGIVRTRRFPEPSKTFLWYTNKLGYEVIASYPGEDGRVILSRNFDGLRKKLI